MNTEMLTTKEVSEILGRPVYRIRRMAKSGKLKGSKIGRQWQFKKEDVEKYRNNIESKESNRNETKGDDDIMSKKEGETVLDDVVKTKKRQYEMKELDKMLQNDEIEKISNSDIDFGKLIELAQNNKALEYLLSSDKENNQIGQLLSLLPLLKGNEESEKTNLQLERRLAELEGELKNSRESAKEQELRRELRAEIADLKTELKKEEAKKGGLFSSNNANTSNTGITRAEVENIVAKTVNEVSKSKTTDWSGILTGAGSVISSLIQVVPLLRSEGVDVKDVMDSVFSYANKISETRSKSETTNFDGLTESIINVVGQALKNRQEQEPSQAETPADELGSYLTRLMQNQNPAVIAESVEQILPFVSDEKIKEIQSFLSQIDPQKANEVADELRKGLEIDLLGDEDEDEDEDEAKKSEKNSNRRPSPRFDSETTHDIDIEGKGGK